VLVVELDSSRVVTLERSRRDAAPVEPQGGTGRERVLDVRRDGAVVRSKPPPRHPPRPRLEATADERLERLLEARSGRPDADGRLGVREGLLEPRIPPRFAGPRPSRFSQT